jgi:hypothetical protein
MCARRVDDTESRERLGRARKDEKSILLLEEDTQKVFVEAWFG